MKHFDTELKKYAAKVKLKAAERRELRERILSYMEYHPLPKRREPIVSPYEREKIASEPFVFVSFNTLYTRIAAAAFAFILVIGVPLAASRAVPGDALYMVKRGINEKIEEQFANSPYKRVAFETRLIERRIAEARLLASEGKLTEEVEAEIAETVKTHADSVQNGIAELKAQDANSAAIAEISFGSALEVQSAVLAGTDDVTAATATDSILDVVMVAKASVSENQGTTLPSYDALVASVESETTRAVELFESIKDVIDLRHRQDIERRLADINRKLERAQDSAEKNPEKAVDDLLDALGLTQKLVVFMTDIDVREHVELESLVPVELTVEERMAAAAKLLGEVEELYTRVNERLPHIVDADSAQKTEEGIGTLAELYGSATTTYAAGDIDTLEQILSEAYALALDLDALTAADGTTPETSGEEEQNEETPTTTEEGTDPATSSEAIDTDQATSTDA